MAEVLHGARCRLLPAIFICLAVVLSRSGAVSQDQQSQSKSDSALSTLMFPVSFGEISVLDSFKDHVTRWFGEGYYTEAGGHLGTSYYTDSRRHVLMRIEWGVDWHVDMIEFSYGAEANLPDSCRSIQDLPKTSISAQVRSALSLGEGIKLGATLESVLTQLGRPSADSTSRGRRVISYSTDYRTTKDVLFYEATFWFRNNHLVRLSVYNGE